MRRKDVTDYLVYLAQRPGLPMERVDLLLQTLLETHPRGAKNALGAKLLPALRAESVDARARVHDALVFLSKGCKNPADAGLQGWKTTDHDSSTALEEKINAWAGYWNTGCS